MTIKTLFLFGLLAASTGNMALAQAKVNKKTDPKPGSAVSKTAAPADPGAVVFGQYCLACHQTDGGGVPNMYPSLRGTDWVTGDKNRLIMVLLNGLQNVDIDGESYDNPMPAHAHLTDRQIADVLTYIRVNFTNKADAIRPEEVTALRK
jgi:mono/diheme cytochrome c family protein